MNKIEEYIQNRLKGRTKKTYKVNLNRFFRDTKIKSKTPEKYLKMNTEQQSKILIEYIIKEQEKGTPPRTIYGIQAAVKGFLLYNNIELPPNIKSQLRYMLKNTSTLTIKDTLTKKQLGNILQHSKEAIEKAIFLIAASSGMRINEILSLTPENIDFNHTPTKITIPGKLTKTKRSRITFISNEATDTLKAYLKNEREKWLKNAVSRYSTEKLNRKKTFDDKRIFPMSYENTRIKWNRLLKTAKLDQEDISTNLKIYGIHTLRGYFKSRMTAANINRRIIDILVGHKIEPGQYTNLPIKELANEYLKAMPELEIYEKTPDLTEITDKQNYQEKMITKLIEENNNLKQQIDNLQEGLKLLTDTIKFIPQNKPLNQITAKETVKAMWKSIENDIKELPPELQEKVKKLKKQYNI